MKKTLFSFLALVAMGAWAADIEFDPVETLALTLTTDRENGRYLPGETVTYTLGGTINGTAIETGRKFRLTWFAGSEKVSETVVAYDSANAAFAYVPEKTGSYLLRAMPLKADGTAAVNEWQDVRCGLICDFDNISKPMTGDYFPNDFDAWWDAEVAAQHEKTFKDGKLDFSKVQMIPYDFQGCTDEQKEVYLGRSWWVDAFDQTANYDVRIPAAGANWVAGGLSMPKDAMKKYPAVINFYGVGWDGVCAIDPVGARDNHAIYFNVNAHGLPEGASWDVDYPKMREEIESYAAQHDEWGKAYQQIGKGEGRDNFYYRHVFLRAAQAVEFIKALPQWDGKTLIVNGRSQGSAQSVAAAALAEGVTHMFLGISAMCDFTGPANDPKRSYSWPFNTRYPVHPESDYFDCVNFAHRLHGKKIRMVFGCTDDLCPVTGPVSLYNALPADNVKVSKSIAAMGHDGVRSANELNSRVTAVLKGQPEPPWEEEKKAEGEGEGEGQGEGQGEGESPAALGANERLTVFDRPGEYAFSVPDNVTGTAQLLVVGGGGSGGNYSGGGGGGGQVVFREITLVANQKYKVVVGAGGAVPMDARVEGKGAYASGNNGGDSSFGTDADAVVAIGGGGGGGNGVSPGKDGGNGGGGGGNGNGAADGGKAAEGGFPGGNRLANYWGCAGGGGAGERGHDGYDHYGTQDVPYMGCGGKGRVISITGEPVMYAPGGGGNSAGKKWTDANGEKRYAGLGGADDGYGNADNDTDNATPGKDGVGGGGGGGRWQNLNYPASRGGCGTVIIRYSVEPVSGFMLNVKW